MSYIDGFKKEAERAAGVRVSPFEKHDQGKRRWSLLPWGPLGVVVDVLGHGSDKYSDNNWQKCEKPTRYLDAAFRHLTAHAQGEFLDPETGKPHLAHAVCDLLFLLWFES